jgi:tetratricopeptide (TPR) repeat protein
MATSFGKTTSDSRQEAVREVQELLQRKELAAAEKRLGEALKEFPRDAALQDLYGVVEAERADYRAAEAAFLKAIELDPLLAGAYLNLGHLYQERRGVDPGADAKALAIYQRLLKFDPGNAEAHYQAALLLERRRAFQESLDHLAALPAAGQQAAQALSLRCADLTGLGRRAAAGRVARQLLDSPDLTELDITTILPVIEAAREEDLEQQLLEGAVQRHVAGFNLLEALGRLYERRGRWEAARATLEEAARARPNSVEALMELARVAEKQNDHRGALGYLAHARDLDPQNAAVHFAFGLVSAEENLLEEAYRSMKRAVRLAPDNADYNYALGMVARERAEPREALPYFEKYCALRPRDPRGWLQLGITHFYGHQDEAAEKELRRAAPYRQTAAAAHFFLGRIANQEGQFSKALLELRQARAADPHYADPYAEEGIIYMKQKDYAAAERALLHALAIDPDHYAANLNLMMLYERTGDPRAGEQRKRFEAVETKRAERAKLSLRTIEVVR